LWKRKSKLVFKKVNQPTHPDSGGGSGKKIGLVQSQWLIIACNDDPQPK